MRAIRILLGLGLVAVAWLPAPAAGQLESELKIDASAPKVDIDGTALVDGRLPANRTLRIQFEFVVTVPPLTVCRLPITVRYALVPGPEGTRAIMSPESQTQAYQGEMGLPVGVQARVMSGWTTVVSVARDGDEEPNATAEFGVAARARGGSTPEGCNLRESATVKSRALVRFLVEDAAPGLPKAAVGRPTPGPELVLVALGLALAGYGLRRR